MSTVRTGSDMVDKAIWDEINAASRSASQVVPQVVMRYRSMGTLTWALLHQMEDEVLAMLEKSEAHVQSTLSMIRSAPVFRYPKDERPASFAGASVRPIIFGQIEDAWRLVH